HTPSGSPKPLDWLSSQRPPLTDAVLEPQEAPQRLRHDPGDLLPEQEAAAGAEFRRPDGRVDPPPGPQQIRAPAVAHYGEGVAVMVCGQDITDQLVGDVLGVPPRQAVGLEDLPEAGIALHDRSFPALEVGLGQLRLDDPEAYPGVNLRVV